MHAASVRLDDLVSFIALSLETPLHLLSSIIDAITPLFHFGGLVIILAHPRIVRDRSNPIGPSRSLIILQEADLQRTFPVTESHAATIAAVALGLKAARDVS
jgi:hypothetical protein